MLLKPNILVHPLEEGNLLLLYLFILVISVHPLEEGKSAYSAVNEKSIPKQTFLNCLFGSPPTIAQAWR